jgi:hypothetical protein
MTIQRIQDWRFSGLPPALATNRSRSNGQRERHWLRGPLVAIFAAVLSVTLATLVAPSVEAAPEPHRNGICDDDEFCYYFNSDLHGSISDMNYSLRDYGAGGSCNHFIGIGNGQGQCIKNNAASAWNRTKSTVRVYYNSNFEGKVFQDFAPGERGNLRQQLKNENASHQFLNLQPPPVVLGPGLCETWTDGHDGHAQCTGGQGQWRLKVDCVWARDKYSEWQETSSETRSIVVSCPNAARGADIEDRP